MLIDVNRYRRNVYESLRSKESAGKRQFDRLLPRKRIVFLFAEASKAEVVLRCVTYDNVEKGASFPDLQISWSMNEWSISPSVPSYRCLITVPSRQINSRIIKFVGSTEGEVCNLEIVNLILKRMADIGLIRWKSSERTPLWIVLPEQRRLNVTPRST